MKDTVWNGQVKRLVTDDGIPKGMKLVLQKRGVNTDGMNARAMREKLGSFPDFVDVPTLVEELVRSRSHICLFFPKFHCELNAIERVWCHAKIYAGKHVNGSITRLRAVVSASLDSCQPELIS